LFALSGTSLGRVAMPEVIMNLRVHWYDQPTLFDRLNEQRISWKVYSGDAPLSLLFAHQWEPQNAARYRLMTEFYRDVTSFRREGDPAKQDLPFFTFIEPSFCQPGANDDAHPPHDILAADNALVASVYNAIRANNNLWEQTLLVVAFDAHGGFFDHVTPPPTMPPDYHQDEYSFDQLGVRVPVILVSPWVKSAVFTVTMDHTSLLKYLTGKWSLGPLGYRTHSADTFDAAFVADMRNDALQSIVGSMPAAPTKWPTRRPPQARRDYSVRLDEFNKLKSEFAAAKTRRSSKGVAQSSGGRLAVDALIMKGGGVKGLAFAGAIQELEKHYEFETYVGTSAGSIAAALLAAGANGADLETMLSRKPFREFLDGNLWLAPISFWARRGLHPGFALVNWLRDQLNHYHPQQRDVTLADLHSKGKCKRAVIYASTSRSGRVTWDSDGEHSGDAVHTAVRCSISIPYFFQPQWISNRRVYDGGLLNNYPVEIFLDQERRTNHEGPEPSFIALYLGSSKPDKLGAGAVISDLLHIVVDRNDAEVIDRYPSSTILIDTEPIGTIDFDLSDKEKHFLVMQGRAAALKYLDQKSRRSDSAIETSEEAERLHHQVIEDAVRLQREIVDERRKRKFRRRIRVGIGAVGALGLWAFAHGWLRAFAHGWM